MAQQQLGIRLTLDGTATVTGGLSQVSAKLSDLDSGAVKVGDAFGRLGSVGAGVFNNLKGAVLGLVGVVGSVQLAREFVAMADSMTLLNARLRLATGGGDDFTKSQKAIYDIAQANNLGLQETSTLYTKLLGPVQRLGGGVAENTAIVSAFSTALRVGGATTEAAASATLQFAQAMGSGVLRGEEFNAVNEASPRVMQALAEGMGQPIERLRKMAEEGKLTADVVGNALVTQLGKLRAEAAQMPDTVGGAFQRMKNDVALLVDEMNKANGITLGLADAIDTTNSFVMRIAQAFRAWSASSQDTSSSLDGVAIGVKVIGTVLETLIVLAADVSYVFKTMGREIGGIIAQFSALGEGGGIFSAEGRAAWVRVGEEIRFDAQKSREELDRFKAAVLGASDRVLQQRDALRNNALTAAENRNEIERLGNQHAATALKKLELKNATDEGKKALEQATKAGRDYMAQLDEQLRALELQLFLGRDLSKAEEARLKLEADLREGKKRLTEQERQSAFAKLEEVEALRQQIAQQKDYEKTLVAVAQQSTKLNQAQAAQTDSLRDSVIKLQEQNDALNLSERELVARQAQLDRTRADELEWQAAMEGGNYQLEEQARLLRRRAELSEQGVVAREAKVAADEWKKVTDSINDGLTDALMRAFESGKGFAQAFRDTLVNAFKSLVLQPTIKAILAPIGGALGSLFTGSAMAGGGTAAGGAGGLGSLLSMGANFLGGKSIAAGASGAVIRLGDWLSTSSSDTLARIGEFITGNSGIIGSGLGMLGNAFAGYGISKGLSGGYSAGNWVNTVAGIASAIPGIGPIAGVVGALVNRAFGRRAKEARDSGITGSFTAGGVDAQAFQDWFQKGGWFRSDRSGTDLSALGAETSDALRAGAFGVLSSTQAWAAALRLPADALSRVTTQFRVKLTGNAEQDQAELQRLFERYSDDLAATYQAQLRPFQRAGETLSATLQRLAGLQQFSEAINDFGGVFSRIAGLSVDAKEQLIAFAGGIDALLGKTRAFVGAYYSEAEQAGLAARALQQQLGALGITEDLRTRADFRALVESTDVSSEAGRQRLAQLLDIAAAFAPVGQYLEAQGTSLSSVAGMAPASAVLQDLLSGPASTQQATVDGLSALQETTEASGNATLGALERLIERVAQLETALVGALERNARTVSDAVILESGAR